MELSRDFEELFSTFNAHSVRYLVAGSHAVMHYSEPRLTKDLDVWVPAELNRPAVVRRALRRFGAPLAGVTESDLADPNVVLQIGIPPIRVDILMSLPGVNARTAWRRRVRSHYGRTAIAILSRTDVILAKRAAGRPVDRLDLRRLLGSAGRGRKRG